MNIPTTLASRVTRAGYVVTISRYPRTDEPRTTEEGLAMTPRRKMPVWTKHYSCEKTRGFRTRRYIYSADAPMASTKQFKGWIARRYSAKYPWIEDIDKNGNPVGGCTLGYTTLKEAQRRCELCYKKRRPKAKKSN